MIQTFLKNRDPPRGFQNSQIEIGTFLGPRLLGHCPKFSRFSILTPPLSEGFKNKRTSNLGFWAEVRGEGSEGFLGAQPVIRSVL